MALGPDSLAQAAMAIIAALPPGAFVSPIGVDPAYPSPHDPPFESVVDTVYGGNRYVEWYTAHPVPDVSGLVVWVSPYANQPVAGITAAQGLAIQVMNNGGDTTPFADFAPQNADQLTSAGNQNPTTVLPQNGPTSYVPTPPPALDPAFGDSSQPVPGSLAVAQTGGSPASTASLPVTQTGSSIPYATLDPIPLAVNTVVPPATVLPTVSAVLQATVAPSSSSIGTLGLWAGIAYLLARAFRHG